MLPPVPLDPDDPEVPVVRDVHALLHRAMEIVGLPAPERGGRPKVPWQGAVRPLLRAHAHVEVMLSSVREPHPAEDYDPDVTGARVCAAWVDPFGPELHAHVAGLSDPG